jgi:hypothetical protein
MASEEGGGNQRGLDEFRSDPFVRARLGEEKGDQICQYCGVWDYRRPKVEIARCEMYNARYWYRCAVAILKRKARKRNNWVPRGLLVRRSSSMRANKTHLVLVLVLILLFGHCVMIYMSRSL